jgi:hypothetical protein
LSKEFLLQNFPLFLNPSLTPPHCLAAGQSTGANDKKLEKNFFTIFFVSPTRF